MSDQEYDVQLNISTEFVPNRPKRQKVTKRQRLDNKRQERRLMRNESSVTKNEHKADAPSSLEQGDEQQSAPKQQSDPTQRKKRKADSVSESKVRTGDKYAKKMRVSSIFTKNPVIPHVKSSEVQPRTEAVFSDKGFGNMNLHPFMVSNLEDKFELKTATAVQQAAIPKLLQGRDVLVKSQTGSGKTLAYAIPVVHKLQCLVPKIKRTDGLYAVVIVPTRELALQSYDTFEKLLRSFTWIVPGIVMGGEKRKSEKARLRKGINVLVGTPGRLMDHLENTHCVNMTNLSCLVIDEADRLLDLGFEKEVSKILGLLNEHSTMRQTILVSATLSEGVERLAGMTLKDPVKIDIREAESGEQENNNSKAKLREAEPGEQENSNNKAELTVNLAKKSVTAAAPTETFATPESLKHHYMIVPSKLRLVTLAAFILWKCKYSEKSTKMIIFLATQDSVEFHYNLLDKTINLDEEDEEDDRIVDFFRLHGDMAQKDRTKVYKDFVQTPAGVLFCTDVAARGLDLPNVRWIVQYNTPGKATDYIHRVGRTARVGTKGNALLFLTPQESEYLRVLKQNKIQIGEILVNSILKTLQLHVQTMPVTKKFSQQAPSTIQECATALQAQFEDFIAENRDIRTMARKAYQSFVRAYATYPSDLKHIFHVKSLHIGHTATSFALQEAPRKIGSIVGNTMSQKKFSKWSSSRPKGVKPKVRHQMVSEFSSGLQPASSEHARKSTGIMGKKKIISSKMK